MMFQKAIRIRLQYTSKCDRTVHYRTDPIFENWNWFLMEGWDFLSHCFLWLNKTIEVCTAQDISIFHEEPTQTLDSIGATVNRTVHDSASYIIALWVGLKGSDIMFLHHRCGAVEVPNHTKPRHASTVALIGWSYMTKRYKALWQRTVQNRTWQYTTWLLRKR